MSVVLARTNVPQAARAWPRRAGAGACWKAGAACEPARRPAQPPRVQTYTTRPTPTHNGLRSQITHTFSGGAEEQGAPNSSFSIGHLSAVRHFQFTCINLFRHFPCCCFMLFPLLFLGALWYPTLSLATCQPAACKAVRACQGGRCSCFWYLVLQRGAWRTTTVSTLYCACGVRSHSYFVLRRHGTHDAIDSGTVEGRFARTRS